MELNAKRRISDIHGQTSVTVEEKVIDKSDEIISNNCGDEHSANATILQQVKSILIELKNLAKPWDDVGTSLLESLLNIRSENKGNPIITTIGEFMAANDLLAVCVRIWDSCCKIDIMNEKQYYWETDAFFAMKRVLWNYTDNSLHLAKAAFDNKELVERYMTELSFRDFHIEHLKEDRKRFLARATLAMLYNVVRLYPPNYFLIEKNDGVQKVLKYYTSEDTSIKAGAIMLLAYCIKEEENDAIVADNKVIGFMMEALDSTLRSSNHISDEYGLSTTEIVTCLDKLASNDSNKKSLIDAGVLVPLTKILEENKDEKEVSVTTHCLWTLSFHPDNKKKFKEVPRLLSAVNAILHHSKPESYIARSCNGINFVVDGVQVEPRTVFAKKVSPQHFSKGHIMISYQWNVQSSILQLRDKLKESGYFLWIDVDDMEGDILSAMAQAVENAGLVIIAITEYYKNSNACRTEATYAYKLSKPILPLLLQPNYKPDGWLGALIGMELYLDLSDQDTLDAKYDKLLEMIDVKMRRGQNSETELVVPGLGQTITSNDESNQNKSFERNLHFSNWTKTEVLQWALETEIDGLLNALSSYDGKALAQIAKLMKRSPDIYYGIFRNDLQLQWIDFFHFTDALEKMNN